MGALKGWLLWILLIALGLLGWQIILWLMNKTSITKGVAKSAAKITGTGDGTL